MTLAQCISELVTLLYKKLGLMVPSHCTHEVRAWSTSHRVPSWTWLSGAWRAHSLFFIFEMLATYKKMDPMESPLCLWFSSLSPLVLLITDKVNPPSE